MEELQVLYHEALISGEELRTTLEDLGANCIFIYHRLQASHSYVNVARETTLLTSIRKHFAESTLGHTTFALNAAHRSCHCDPNERDRPGQKLTLCRVALLDSLYPLLSLCFPGLVLILIVVPLHRRLRLFLPCCFLERLDLHILALFHLVPHLVKGVEHIVERLSYCLGIHGGVAFLGWVVGLQVIRVLESNEDTFRICGGA